MISGEHGQKRPERSGDLLPIFHYNLILIRINCDDKIKITELVHRICQKGPTCCETDDATIRLQRFEGQFQESSVRVGD